MVAAGLALPWFQRAKNIFTSEGQHLGRQVGRAVAAADVFPQYPRLEERNEIEGEISGYTNACVGRIEAAFRAEEVSSRQLFFDSFGTPDDHNERRSVDGSPLGRGLTAEGTTPNRNQPDGEPRTNITFPPEEKKVISS